MTLLSLIMIPSAAAAGVLLVCTVVQRVRRDW